MRSITIILTSFILHLQQVLTIEVDCSMSDTTRCDCIYADAISGTLPGVDCRVCRVEKQLACVLWFSGGTRYGPLCENPECPEGSSWKDGKNTPGGCYCDWKPKEHERKPCPWPAGDCKCNFELRGPSGAIPSSLPGEICTVCPEDPAKGPYYCTERGSRENKYGTLCTGDGLGPQCTGKGCFCNWQTTVDGVAWKNGTQF